MHVPISGRKTHNGLLIMPELTFPRRAISNLSPPTMEEQAVRTPSPNIILRCDNDFLGSHKSAWDSSSDAEDDVLARKVPDVRRDDLASRRAPRGPVPSKVHHFVPPPVCSSKDRERWEGIRRASQKTLKEKEIRLASVYLCAFLSIISNFLLNISFLSLGVICGLVYVCVGHFDAWDEMRLAP